MHRSNSDSVASYLAGARARRLPFEVEEAARLCLADWVAVSIGALDEEAATIMAGVVNGWNANGTSALLTGGHSAAAGAALVNGTLAHCLDFDDTYVRSNTHTSAPLWSATLALGQQVNASEGEMLRAFVAGFEAAAAIGDGLGEAVTSRGWHATGVFGRLAAAASGAVLFDLDEERIAHALGIAATQVSGLVGSFGTMSKPFHAGKAAMDGVLAAQLAAGGFVGSTRLLEPDGGLDRALLQDRRQRLPEVEFGTWKILQNSFKPYAACHLTHPAVDAGRAAHRAGVDPERIKGIEATVGALALQVTGDRKAPPTTPLEAKFDLKYCVAMALHGRALSASDFKTPFSLDEAVAKTAQLVAVCTSQDVGYAAARLAIQDTRGARVFEIPIAKGHPGNPMLWEDMEQKFNALVTGHADSRTRDLFDAVRSFGGQGNFAVVALNSFAEQMAAF